MTKFDPNFIAASEKAFQTSGTATLQGVRDAVAAKAMGTRRRDLLSALDTLVRVFGRPLADTPASPEAVRKLLSSQPSEVLQPKRLTNVRSGVKVALEEYGPPIVRLTKRIPPSPDWQVLLDTAPSIERIALYRLACFCTVMKISPTQVRKDHLQGLLAALEHEEATKDPYSIVANTIGVWNRMSRCTKGWPQTRLGMPTERNYDMLPAEEFPESFLADITAWKNSLLRPRRFSKVGPRHALRPATIHCHEQTLKRIGSILVRIGKIKAKDLKSIASLVREDRFVAALEFLLTRFNGETSAYISETARTLYNIARFHVRLPQKQLDTLLEYCRNLEPKRKPRQLAPRNRKLLLQFDDPEKAAALLDYPAKEREQALKIKNPYRRAKGVERAFIGTLFIRTAIRIGTLCQLEMTDFTPVGKKLILSIDGAKVKNDVALQFEFPEEVANLYREFITVYRPRLECPSSRYLFAGIDGRPRYHSSVRQNLKESVFRITGLNVFPHLARHFRSKMIMDHNAELALAVSMSLGHKNPSTTYAYYMGSEQKAAARRMDEVLDKLKSATGQGRKRRRP